MLTKLNNFFRRKYFIYLHKKSRRLMQKAYQLEDKAIWLELALRDSQTKGK